jgi:hypothetical protein
VLLIILVVAGFFAVQRLVRVTRESAHETRWSDLAMTSDPDSYKTIAKGADEPSIQALAYLRGADLLLHRAALPVEPPKPAAAADGKTPAPAPIAPPSAQDRKRMIDDAALMYEQVLALQGAHEVYALNARLGLASVAESRGDLDGARKLYDEVKTQAGEKYAGVAAQASGRLAVLDRLGKPVKFAASAPVAPAPAASSASQVPSLLASPSGVTVTPSPAQPVQADTSAAPVPANP